MDISGSYTFNAPPARVWDLLMDPAAIASCIPGCESLEPEGPDRYHARLTVALAAITGTYEGTVIISDKVEHGSYRLTVEGQGGQDSSKGTPPSRFGPMAQAQWWMSPARCRQAVRSPAWDSG
jgi:carbon monoxide dehydrogenase subunit G